MRFAISQLTRQWQLFCLAVMFFTRLPVPKSTPYSANRLNQANRYFSLVGLLIAFLICIAFFGFSQYFSVNTSVLIAMIFSVFITGAFHEDGLADMADGIGGGTTVERRLAIMKDSRLGAYGAVTLILSLLFKFVLLVDLANLGLFIPSLLLSYALSRAVAASFIFNTPYVSDKATSKSKPLATQQSIAELCLLIVFGCIPLYFFVDNNNFISLLVTLFLVLISFRFLFRRWLLIHLTGFTGDCLGAVQQVCELLIYLVILFHFNADNIMPVQINNLLSSTGVQQ